jgi:hypothetical protein
LFPENKEGKADEVRRSLRIGSYETDGLRGLQGISTNTNYWNAPATHKLHNVKLIMVMVTIVIIIKIITTKKKEIQYSRTSTEEIT